jgi:hypothetical protein
MNNCNFTVDRSPYQWWSYHFNQRNKQQREQVLTLHNLCSLPDHHGIISAHVYKTFITPVKPSRNQSIGWYMDDKWLSFVDLVRDWVRLHQMAGRTRSSSYVLYRFVVEIVRKIWFSLWELSGKQRPTI